MPCAYFNEKAKAEYNDFPAHAIDYLARMYGTKLSQVMCIARNDKSLAAPLNADGEMSAQVVYAIREEMACTLMDILIRRTGIGTLGHPGMEVLEKIAVIAAKESNWAQKRLITELDIINKTLAIP